MTGILLTDHLGTFSAYINCFVSFQLEAWRCLSAWHIPKANTCDANACVQITYKWRFPIWVPYFELASVLNFSSKKCSFSSGIWCKRWSRTYVLLVGVKHWDTFNPLVEKKRNSLYMRKKSTKMVSKQNSSHFYYDRPKMIWLIFRVWSHLTV